MVYPHDEIEFSKKFTKLFKNHVVKEHLCVAHINDFTLQCCAVRIFSFGHSLR